jgi:membrane protease YdiL (CAAX protease family)
MKGIVIMDRLTSWIKSHQVISFFIITFAITWGLGFSYDAVMNKNQFLLAPLVMVATCGPALAGIIISAISNSQPGQGTRKAFWIAFFVAWVVSAIVFIAHNTFINHAPPSPILIGFSIVVVVPVAFVISAAYSRNPAVKSYVSSLIRLRGLWGWSFLALVLMPGLALLSILISNAIGRPPISISQIQVTGLALVGLIAIKFFYQLLFFNATGEEVGWRGFALPRLQARTSPLVASLILGIFWCSWHVFLWQAEGSPIFSWQYWLFQYALHMTTSVIIGWIYNRSKGSILVAGIAHAAANTAAAFFPNLDITVYALTAAVAALVLILVDRMWKKLPSDHPAVYQAPTSDG